MKLITDSLTEKLLANGRAQRAVMDLGRDALDFKVFFVWPGSSSILLSPGDGESEARLRLASRPSAVATSMWQN